MPHPFQNLGSTSTRNLHLSANLGSAVGRKGIVEPAFTEVGISELRL